MTSVCTLNPKLVESTSPSIRITGVLYRLYSRMVTRATDEWATRQGVIPPEMFGFQKKRSTTQAAFVLRHMGSRAAKNQEDFPCAFIDFTQAYDSIPHRQLWRHLEGSLGMPGNLLAAIQSMYEGATYEVHDGGRRTQPIPCTRGIKQGCPLSPALYNLYTSDLPAALAEACPDGGVAVGVREVRSLLYADDLVIPARTHQSLQLMVDALGAYADRKGLAVNTSKSEVLVFRGATGRVERETEVLYKVRPLPRTQVFKYLGIHMSGSGRMQSAVEGRVQPFRAGFHRAVRQAHSKGLGKHPGTIMRLARVYGCPAGEYGVPVWGSGLMTRQQTMVNPIQKELLALLKGVWRLPAGTPGLALIQELGWRPLQSGWWDQVARFYNKAVGQAGAEHSPIMRDAMVADVALATEAGGYKYAWAAEVLAALTELEDKFGEGGAGEAGDGGEGGDQGGQHRGDTMVAAMRDA